MPITKVPIVHRFGIISHTQRLELQERLLKHSYLNTDGKREAGTGRNPLEVTEEFVQQYNSAESYEDKEKNEDIATKMLERTKRRAGLSCGGEGPHVNLPIAWTELSQLAQCKGKIQEECFDVLLTSLDHARLHRNHIPALFFLAETSLFWLRTDSINQPYLRTGEIKLLKMGQLVFTRLFFHHMSGHLQGHQEFKNRLFVYLDGLMEHQDAYNPYPNALLSLRYIIEVGKIIIGDVQVEPGEVKEGDNITNHPPQDKQPSTETEDENLLSYTTVVSRRPLTSPDLRPPTDDQLLFSHVNFREYGSKVSSHALTPNTCFRVKLLLFPEVTVAFDSRSTKSAAISSSVHDLSPTLWHALDVWRCTNQLGGGLKDALRALAQCGLGLANENWVDGVCAIQVLAEAAKCNLSALKVLQNLARGVSPRSPQTTPMPPMDNLDIFEKKSGEERIPSRASNTSPDLSAIFERTENISRSRHKEREASEDELDFDLSQLLEPEKHHRSKEKYETAEKNPLGLDLSELLEHTNVGPTIDTSRSYRDSAFTTPRYLEKSSQPIRGSDFQPIRGSDSRTSGFTMNSWDSRRKITRTSQRNPPTPSQRSGNGYGRPGTQPGTAQGAVAGSDAVGRASQASSVPTFTNIAVADVPGIHGWHWEVAITYADALSDIILHSGTSNVQKVALVGSNKDVNMLHKLGTKNPMSSCGLLDLVFFKAAKEAHDGGSNDWSWRVRYAAIQGLVKVCRCSAGDKSKEGVRTVAWNGLVRAHSLEKDDRVLEALKVGQAGIKVDANMESLMSQAQPSVTCTIGAKIAEGLVKVYLPPRPPPVAMETSRKQWPKVQLPKAKATPRKPLRTSLRQEIMLATALQEPVPDYNKRTSFDLKRVIEDQWRKELQRQQEHEEEEQQRLLEEERKLEEEKRTQHAEQKAERLKRRNKIMNAQNENLNFLEDDNFERPGSGLDLRESCSESCLPQRDGGSDTGSQSSLMDVGIMSLKSPDVRSIKSCTEF